MPRETVVHTCYEYLISLYVSELGWYSLFGDICFAVCMDVEFGHCGVSLNRRF